jgi:hypothetical protein
MDKNVTFEVLIQDIKTKLTEGEEPTPSKIQSALKSLDGESKTLFWKLSKGRLQCLFGFPIAGIVLDDPLDRKAAEMAMVDFFRQHADLYGLVDAQVDLENLAVNKAKISDHIYFAIQQYYHGLPVVDGRFTVIFSSDGLLTQVVGGPYGASELPVTVDANISQEDAQRKAIDEVIAQNPDRSPSPEKLKLSAELAISGTHKALIWKVDLIAYEIRAVDAEIWVDAITGEVHNYFDHTSCGLRMIPVRHYSHPNGELNSVGNLAISEVNINTEMELTLDQLQKEVYSLQRTGSGRARIWNGLENGATDPPNFRRTRYYSSKGFTKYPDSIKDKNWVFNEQQTYVWAQTLKSKVDDWGREKNTYGHYPVDNGRDVNVEIVVNVHADLDEPLCRGAMHGCFTRGGLPSWFQGLDTSLDSVPTVLLFNHIDKLDKPQFFGPEISSTYSIIAHEVGHFISWQYGDWEAPTGNLKGSLSEGFSMVIAALFGKDVWPGLAYDNADEVTTGSEISGNQWSRHVSGTPAERYKTRSCSDNKYYLAWPFVQAMWHLVNNVDENGNQIWGSDEAAIHNTIDLFMFALCHCTSNSRMTWDKLASCLVMRMFKRRLLLGNGTEKEPIGPNGIDTLIRVIDVFDEHGLFDECQDAT